MPDAALFHVVGILRCGCCHMNGDGRLIQRMETATQSSAPASRKKRPLLALMTALLGAGCLFLLYLWRTPPLKTSHSRYDKADEFRPPEHSKADFAPAAQMRDQCRKIISALRDFRSHQQVYPVPADVAGDEKSIHPINQAMVAAVDGSDARLNSAQVNYFKTWVLSSRTLKELKAGHFYACFDFDGDGSIPNPASPGGSIRQDVLVWHAGKDGDPLTWGDNVCAWVVEPQVSAAGK